MKQQEVFLSPLAEFKLELLLEYIENEWGLKSKRNFLVKLQRNTEKISIAPESCERSIEFADLYKCVVTKQTTFFYRIAEDAIEIVTVIDNRQNPDKIAEEIKEHFG